MNDRPASLPGHPPVPLPRHPPACPGDLSRHGADAGPPDKPGDDGGKRREGDGGKRREDDGGRSIPSLNPLTRARRLAGAFLSDWRQFRGGRLPRTCPICGYRGTFVSVGHPGRWDARCLNCGSRERHRLLHLWITEGGGDRLAGRRILHFAPEKAFQRRMRGNPLYETADLMQKGVTHTVDITDTKLPGESYDVVMANHVLEHIPDDRAAMRELFRLLKPGGLALLSVPVNATRRETYENPAITSQPERWAHFSAHDHLRYYGLDFADRLAGAGFAVETFRVSPEEEVRHGLLRDEWIYVARKPGAG